MMLYFDGDGKGSGETEDRHRNNMFMAIEGFTLSCR